MRLPNFIHAGTPKSASATVRAILGGHPDIYIPRQKEPNFFLVDDQYAQGLDWYASEYFEGAGSARIVGDLSISYTTGFGFDVPERIARALGDNQKILLTFRDPVERAYSQWAMAHYKGQLDLLDFASAIDRALVIGSEIDNTDRQRVRSGTYYSSARDMDVFRWCMYIETGYYADIFHNWSSIFGKENVLVLFTGDLANDLQGQADRLFAFLNLSSMPVQRELRVNQATTLRYPKAKRLLNRLYAIGPLRRMLNAPGSVGLRRWLRRQLLSGNYVPNTTRPPADPSSISTLRAHYLPQIERLEKMLDCDLSDWRETV